MLTMLAMQKELALMELQNRGVSLEEIYGLTKILACGMAMKYEIH